MCPMHPTTPTPPNAAAPEVVVYEEKAQLDFSKSMSYGDYLQLDAILGAQKPLSPDHNEVLFIIQHQTSELWMKLMLHELHAAIANVAADELGDAFKKLARVSKIMEQLVHAWDVLATMTPPEYSAIRPYLANSRGFQSAQYRCIEFALGNKNAAMLKPHAHRPDLLAQVQAVFLACSPYDEAHNLSTQHQHLPNTYLSAPPYSHGMSSNFSPSTFMAASRPQRSQPCAWKICP